MQAFAELLQKLPSDRLSFALRSLPYHLAGSDQLTRLHDLLADFRFLEIKVKELDTQALVMETQSSRHRLTAPLSYGMPNAWWPVERCKDIRVT